MSHSRDVSLATSQSISVAIPITIRIQEFLTEFLATAVKENSTNSAGQDVLARVCLFVVSEWFRFVIIGSAH